MCMLCVMGKSRLLMPYDGSQGLNEGRGGEKILFDPNLSLRGEYLNFCLIFVFRLWCHPQRLKVLLFAGAKSGVGGLEFQQLKKRVKSNYCSMSDLAKGGISVSDNDIVLLKAIV